MITLYDYIVIINKLNSLKIMDNDIKQEIKGKILNEITENFPSILREYQIKEELIKLIVSDISILSILSIDKNLIKE